MDSMSASLLRAGASWPPFSAVVRPLFFVPTGVLQTQADALPFTVPPLPPTLRPHPRPCPAPPHLSPTAHVRARPEAPVVRHPGPHGPFTQAKSAHAAMGPRLPAPPWGLKRQVPMTMTHEAVWWSS